MNNGLINITGNLINTVKVIVDDGLSVGGVESIKLKQEKEKAARIIPELTINKFITFHILKKNIPIRRGTNEKTQPYKNELITLPKRIVLIETGQQINLSSVFNLVSNGNTTGPIELEVKKSSIAIKPDII